MTRQILVTAALPYANGPIHLGHLVEYIQTDIWVRFQKLRGNRCIFLCADDTHGTAIMIRARQEGRSEEALIADMRENHLRDFAGFDIEFDNYGSTHSAENRRLCGEIWSALRRSNSIVKRDVQQLYDPEAGTFLADRFVKGTCPMCKTPDQYGDNCEKCSSTYSPSELIDPVSTLIGAKPELRSAPHLFIQFEARHEFLNEWTQTSGALQTEVANYLKGHFLGEPLRDWDVSRPAPYFGFEIPDSPAITGTCGSTRRSATWPRCNSGAIATAKSSTSGGRRGSGRWSVVSGQTRHSDSQTPDDQTPPPKSITSSARTSPISTRCSGPVLVDAGFQLPTKIHIHGFLTVGGEKMSKSKGTFVQAATYLKHLNPAYLRYYYATKLSPRVDDLDLNLDEFVAKVNSDLVGKVVNLASRTARFVEETGLSPTYPDDGGLFASAAEEGTSIAAAYETCDYNRAMRQIMLLADRANQFVDAKAPWKLRKEAARAAELQNICTIALNLFRQLAIYLAPVLPKLAEQTGELLNQPITGWNQAPVRWSARASTNSKTCSPESNPPRCNPCSTKPRKQTPRQTQRTPLAQLATTGIH